MSTIKISDNNQEKKEKEKKFIILKLLVNEDENLSISDIIICFLMLLVFGCALGIVCLPKEEDTSSTSNDLNTLWYYPYISNCIGYSYALIWSVSWYPQIITNYYHKSTVGLSIDYCILSIIGYACYTIYTASFLFNFGKKLQEQYEYIHHGDDSTVQYSDFIFGMHAFILSCFWLFQIFYYSNNNDANDHSIEIIASMKTSLLSNWITCAYISIFILITFSLLVTIFISNNTKGWLSFLYLLSCVKVGITIVQYLPQAILNYKRKSTTGWNIWNNFLDIMGGILSLLQLIIDSWNMHDWDGLGWYIR